MGIFRGLRVRSLIVYTILFLFFFQLLTDLVAGIYAYGVLGTDLPIEMVFLAFFLSPFLLLFFRRGVPDTVLIILAEGVLLCRALEVITNIRLQIIISAIGVGLFLFLFPAYLWTRQKKNRQAGGTLMSGGLMLAIAISILLRSLGGTMDLSNVGMFRLLAWLFGLLAAVLVPGVFSHDPEKVGDKDLLPAQAGGGRITALAVGMLAVFLLSYAGFTSPIVISRWTGTSYLLIIIMIIWVLILFGWLMGSGTKVMERLSRSTMIVLTAIFGLALTVTLAVHQVAMPTDPALFPLEDPEISTVWIIPLVIMLLTYPVLFLDFGLLVNEITNRRPSFSQLGFAFGIASLLMLLFIMLIIFTSTWSYVAIALEPVVRNRFWQFHGLVAILLTLSLIFINRERFLPGNEALGQGPGQLFTIMIAALGFGALLGAILLAPKPPDGPVTAESLKVVGYNLQQGYSAGGERGHQEQCEVLKVINADIVALSETDTSRIAGGNFDIVQFIAQCLDMGGVFVGPKTGVGTFGYALLSKYKLENPQTFHLFSGPGYPSSSKPDGTSDGDQVAVLKAQVRAGGETFTIFVNHFDSDPPYEQPRGFASLAADVSENVIAIGDYNCRPGSECVDIILDVLDHCDLETAEDHIDHIFVSSDLSCSDFTYIDSNASDHPAVAAEISW